MNLNPPKVNMSSLIAGGVVITVVVVIVAGFALKSLAGTLSLNNELLSKKRQAQRQITENLNSLEALKNEYANLGSKRQLIYDGLPTTPNFAGIVSMMENLSKNAGVSMASIAPAEAEITPEENVPTTYEFSASIEGKYSSFKAFLQNIEKSMRPMAITSMTISGDNTLLTIDMKIKTYYQKEFDTALKTVPLTGQDPGESSESSSSGTGTNTLNPSGATP